MPSRGYMSTIIDHISSIVISLQTKKITFGTFNNKNQAQNMFSQCSLNNSYIVKVYFNTNVLFC